jgi:hypothetical protein
VTDSPIEYAKSIALSAKRRDDAHMKDVFERHKDVDGGLSKAAFIAALKEVEAPVLFSSDSASEDDLFRRADTNASGSVDLSEYALPGSDTHCVCGNSVMRRFMLAANLPDDLEMLLAAGHGVAMHGAPEAVQRAARHLAPPCDEAGAARMIERLILGLDGE